MLVSIVLFILLILSFLSFILLFPFGLYQYAIIPLIIFFILLLFFRKYINLNKVIINIEKFIQINAQNEGSISFSSNNDVYSCVENDEIISFSLKGFILKKSFIRAFIVRQIRYKTVSNKLKISKLFSIRLKCKCKYDKLYLFINKHKYLIFSNNISKNTFLSSEISKSKFAAMYNSARTYFASNVVEKINEKIYLDFYKFY